MNERMRYLRMKMGLTQQQMADMLNITLNTYQKYEQAERTPDINTIVHIADILDISLDYLACRDDGLKESYLSEWLSVHEKHPE